MATEVTAELVRSMFDYDPSTGHLLHKFNRARCKRGDRGGSLKPNGYRQVNIKGRLFQSARIVWLHQYGEWPRNQVDHINHVRDDDRLENLRDVTPQQNSHNLSGKRKNNTSGAVGVTWHARSKRWYAFIYVKQKAIFLGSHATYEEAVAARHAGKVAHHQTP